VSTSDKRGPLQVTRRARLLEALQRDGVLRISDLTSTLGAAAVTIRRDIAQLASEGLVRRVHGGVALPSSSANSAPLGLSDISDLSGGSIGMLVPSLDYYFPDVARGAEEAARELDMRIVLRGSSYESPDDLPLLKRLAEQGADALIVAPRMDAPTSARTIEWLAEAEIPVVLLERTAAAGPHHEVLESVVTDHALGAAMAVRHLQSLGHTRIGAVLAEHSPTTPHVRRGFDLPPSLDIRVPNARHPSSAAALDAVLDECRATGTTALLIHADAEAIALVQRCEDRGLTVPGDLSVVAYDDAVAGLFTPALTAVRPPRGSIGRAAVRLVADRLADPGRPAHRVVISPSLRLRQSTAALA
jgi:DNA-binding LacI/PurR family transcriptional regulator